MMANTGTQYLPAGGSGQVPQFFGVYLAYVAVNQDPLAQGRCKLRVPQVLGNSTTAWADPVVPLEYVPAVGTAVAAMFLGGDPTRPIYLGNLIPPGGYGGGTTVTIAATAPSNPSVGDIWYNTSAGNQQNEWNGSAWVAYTIGSDALADGAVENANLAPGSVATSNLQTGSVTQTVLSPDITARTLGGNTVSIGDTEPTSPINGDTWIETNSSNDITSIWTYNGTWIESTIDLTTLGGLQIIASTTAPSSPNTGDLWINESESNTLEQWNGTAWVAYQFGSNAIAPQGITASNIANATITSDQIASGTITGGNIASATITGSNLESATVTGGNIASATITGGNIDSATITGTNIASGTITGANIGSGEITATNIANATITSGQIASGTITGSNIDSATITGSNIASGTISASNITDATITATQIASDAGITGGQIAGGTITASNIENATITGTQIASNAGITGGQIAGGTITATNIESGSITNAQIASNAGITGSQIAGGTITASNIESGTITNTQIASGSITGSSIAAGTITASNIESGTITGTQIAAGSITGSNIGSGAITASNIENATITSTQIASGSITGGNIASGAITAANIANETITSTQIANGTITTTEISPTADISGSQIASSTVTPSNLSSAVTARALGGITTTVSNIQPSSPKPGDIWINTTEANQMYQYAEPVFSNQMFFGDFSNTASAQTVGTQQFPAVIPKGAAMFLEITTNTSATFTVTDSAGQTWTQIASEADGTSGSYLYLFAFFNTVAMGANSTVTITPSTTISAAVYGGWWALGVTGVETVYTANGTGTAASITVPATSSYALTSQVFSLGSTTIPTLSSGLSFIPYGSNNGTVNGVELAETNAYALNGPSASTTYTSTVYGTSGWGWIVVSLTIAAAWIPLQFGAAALGSGVITASQIAANTITGNNIAASTITGGKIAAGTITASNIESATITSSQIAADTITGGNIAGTTITGSNIAANTISGGNIAAGTITAGNIESGTITGTQIAGSTITGSNIAAGTITASNIESATITGTQIAAGTVTANNIAANTITSAQIEAGTITTSDINFTASQIGGITTTIGTLPATANVGDIWYDTSNDMAVYECVTAYTSGGTMSDWALYQFGSNAVATGAIGNNQSGSGFFGWDMLSDPQFGSTEMQAARLADPATNGSWSFLPASDSVSFNGITYTQPAFTTITPNITVAGSAYTINTTASTNYSITTSTALAAGAVALIHVVTSTAVTMSSATLSDTTGANVYTLVSGPLAVGGSSPAAYETVYVLQVHTALSSGSVITITLPTSAIGFSRMHTLSAVPANAIPVVFTASGASSTTASIALPQITDMTLVSYLCNSSAGTVPGTLPTGFTEASLDYTAPITGVTLVSYDNVTSMAAGNLTCAISPAEAWSWTILGFATTGAPGFVETNNPSPVFPAQVTINDPSGSVTEVDVNTGSGLGPVGASGGTYTVPAYAAQTPIAPVMTSVGYANPSTAATTWNIPANEANSSTGSSLLVYIQSSVNTTFSLSDTQGNNYTQFGSAITSAAGTSYVYFFYAIDSNGLTQNTDYVTVTAATAAAAMCTITAITNVSTISSIVSRAVTTASTSMASVTVPSITAGQTVIDIPVWNQTAGSATDFSTEAAGFTQLSADHQGGLGYYANRAYQFFTTAETNYTWTDTFSTAVEYLSIAVVLNPTTAVGTINVDYNDTVPGFITPTWTWAWEGVGQSFLNMAAVTVNNSSATLALTPSNNQSVWFSSGDTYYFSIAYENHSGTLGADLTVNIVTDAGTVELDYFQQNNSLLPVGTSSYNPGDPQYFSGTLTVPSGAHSGYLSITVSATDSETVYLAYPLLLPVEQYGESWELNGQGFFLYLGDPGYSNLIASFSGASGVDNYGNTYPSGVSIGGATLTGVSIDSTSTLSGTVLSNVVDNSPTITSPQISGGNAANLEIDLDPSGTGGLRGMGQTSSTASTYEVTTAGDGTWTVPANVYSVKVEALGAGGGAGGGTATVGQGGAGGGEYACEPHITVTPGQIISFTVGAGGKGTTSGGGAGQPGGATNVTVGSVTVTANGGSPSSSTGALGGRGSTNTIHYNGGNGGHGTSAGGYAGGGAAGTTGAGTSGGYTSTYGEPGPGSLGTRGGGGGAAPATNTPGGAGESVGGNGGGGGGAAAYQYTVNTATTTYTYTNVSATTTSTTNGTWYGSGSLRGTNTSGYQGEYSGYPADGNQFSLWILSSSFLSTVRAWYSTSSATVTLVNQHSYYDAGMTVQMGFSNRTSVPSSWTSFGSGDQPRVLGSYNIDEGATATFGPANLDNGIFDGAINSFMIGPSSVVSNQYYGYFANSCKIVINGQTRKQVTTGSTGTVNATIDGGTGAPGLVKFTYTVQSAPVLQVSAATVAGTYTDQTGVTHSYPAGFGGTITAFQPNTSPATPEVWHTITLNSPWSGSVSGYSAPQYRMLADGNVQLRGIANYGTAAQTTTISLNSSNPLPTAYRPANNKYIRMGAGDRATIQITTGGVINAIDDGNGYQYAEIDGIYSL